MVVPLKEKAKGNKQTMETVDDDDNQSEATVPSGRPPDNIEFELIEIFLRCEISIKRNNKEDRSPHLCHAAVLHQMYKSFPEEDLQIINNRNKRIQLPNYQKWTEASYHKKHFDINTIPGKGGRPDRHFIVHRIRTTLSLSTIKNDRHVFQALQENNVFLRRHYFLEDEWNTVNLGFILFMDTAKHLRDDARQKVLGLVPNEERHDVGEGDKFQLVAGTPFLHIGGRRIPTKAYTVVCLREHASVVDELLKKIYRKTCHYVKFRLLHKNKQAYYQALKAQNHYLSTLRTIPIVGITQDMMREMDEDILSIPGISDVVRSNRTEQIGRWNILTDEKHFHDVLKFIRGNLKFWMERHFQGNYERPEGFPEVSVTARVADDESSIGECSYLSTSAISYGSYETNGTYGDTDEDDLKPHSYAAAAATRPNSKPTPDIIAGVKSSSVSAMSSPVTIPLEFQTKLLEMDAKLQRYQGLEEKLDRLEQMLSKLLTEPAPPPKANHIAENSSSTTLLSPFTEGHTRVYPNTNIDSPQRRGSNSPVELFAPNGDGTVYSVGFHRPRTIMHQFTPTENRKDTTADTNRQGQRTEPKNNDPNIRKNKDITDKEEWQTVFKRGGKRNAEAHNFGDTKRSDIRGTPTKSANKQPSIYNPYKPDPHTSVRNNRPKTWKNSETEAIENDEHMSDTHSTERSEMFTQPNEESLLAAEARRHS